MNPTLLTLALGLLLVATASSSAAPDPGPDALPDPGTTRLSGSIVAIGMDLTSGRPMIDLRVDGKGPFRFVVDTGAPLSVLDAGIAKDLGLEVVGKQVLRSPGASEEIQGDRVRAGRVEAGGLRIDDPVLATMDLAGFSGGTIDGVLGRSHFRDLLLTLDYPASRLVVTTGALDRSDPAVLGFDADAGSIRFPIDAAGVSLPVVLDTGSPGGFTLPKALESRLRFQSALAPGPTIQLVGGMHQTWKTTLDGTIRLGNVRYEGPEVVLTTMVDDFGNLGFEVLRELEVTLDQANGLVRLARKTAAASAADSEKTVVVRRGGPVAYGGPGGRPRLGVAFEMTPAGFVRKHDGLVVRHVDPDGAADLAGLAVGDIVLSIGGTSITEVEGVMGIGSLVQGARPLEMVVLRGDARVTLVVQ